MAYFLYNAQIKIGDTVYISPNKPGIVINKNTDAVTVKWLDGSITQESAELGIKSYDALLQDHIKKAQTHQTNIEKLRKSAEETRQQLLAHLREFDSKNLTPYDQPGVVYGALETEVRNFNSSNGTDFDPVSIAKEYLKGDK